ncbi:MAG: hypothetical protein QNJ40_07690 [Xanthomonadales bacterium]|nr:hypothetical protein [Xanthomonadales bacterium]
MEVWGAQGVLLPVNLTIAWIFWTFPRRRGSRNRDWLALAVAATAWALSALAAAQLEPADARIWPTVVGATAGFLSFSVVLAAFWFGRFGLPR